MSEGKFSEPKGRFHIDLPWRLGKDKVRLPQNLLEVASALQTLVNSDAWMRQEKRTPLTLPEHELVLIDKEAGGYQYRIIVEREEDKMDAPKSKAKKVQISIHKPTGGGYYDTEAFGQLNLDCRDEQKPSIEYTGDYLLADAAKYYAGVRHDITLEEFVGPISITARAQERKLPATLITMRRVEIVPALNGKEDTVRVGVIYRAQFSEEKLATIKDPPLEYQTAISKTALTVNRVATLFAGQKSTV